jgi:hypothetical protein
MCFPWKHKWSRWEQYETRGIASTVSLSTGKIEIPYSERRQRRHCEICGKEQDELVRKG